MDTLTNGKVGGTFSCTCAGPSKKKSCTCAGAAHAVSNPARGEEEEAAVCGAPSVLLLQTVGGPDARVEREQEQAGLIGPAGA